MKVTVKFKARLNFKLIEKQNKIKMSMAYDCYSIPADCAKVALDEERGLVKVRSVVSKMATQWKNFKTAMKEGRTGKPKAPSHDIVHLIVTIN